MSPKSRFLLNESDTAKALMDIVDGPVFRRASEVALLHFGDTLNKTVDPVEAAALYHQAQGARRFLEILRTLADKPKPLASNPSYALDGSLK